MPPEKFEFTHKDMQDLFGLVRENKATLDNVIAPKLDAVHKVVIGNGDYENSVVGKLAIITERNNRTRLEVSELQKALMEHATICREAHQSHTRAFDHEDSRISRLEEKFDTVLKATKTNGELIGNLRIEWDAARNKLIGVASIAGLGAFSLGKLIEAIFA
jgi:hypothetical protein